MAGNPVTGWTDITWLVNTRGPVSSPNAYGAAVTVDSQFSVYSGGTLTNCEIDVDQTVVQTDATHFSLIGVLLRASQTAGVLNSGYVVQAAFNGGSQGLYFFYTPDGITFNQIGTTKTIAGFANGAKVTIKVQLIGTQFSYKVYTAGGTEPAWATAVDLTDSNIASGQCGLRVSQSGTTGASADNVNIVDLAPTNNIAVTDQNVFFDPYVWESDGAAPMLGNNILTGSTIARTSNIGCGVEFLVNSTTNLGVAVIHFNTSWQSALAANQLVSVVVTVGDVTRTTTILGTGSTQDITISGLSLGVTKIRCESERVGVGTLADRWNNSATGSSVVDITGISLDTSSSLSTYAPRSKNLYVNGDSISEGAEILSAAGATAQDGTLTLWHGFAAGLDASLGQVGWSGQGWIVAGGGNVPVFENTGTPALSTWRNYRSGVSRLISGLLSPAPDYWFNNLGENDAIFSSNVANMIAAITQWLGEARTAAPNAQITIVSVFRGDRAANILTAFGNYVSSYSTTTIGPITIYTGTGTDKKAHLINVGSIGTQVWGDAAPTTPVVTWRAYSTFHPALQGHYDILGALSNAFAVSTASTGGGGGTGQQVVITLSGFLTGLG